MVRTIKINYRITGTKIFLPFQSVCSITNKGFSGEIIIEYHPKKIVLEYVSTEDFINQLAKAKTTAEKLADSVFKKVNKLIKPKYLKVTIDIKRSDAHCPVQVWIESRLQVLP